MLSFIPLMLAIQVQAVPTLPDILERNTRAVGGTAIAAVGTRRVTFILQGAAPGDVPVTVEQKRPRLFRREVGPAGSAQITVLNGKDAWKIDPAAGLTTPTDLSAEEAADLFEDAVVDGDLVNSGAKISLQGVDTLPSGIAYRMLLAYETGRTATVWLDARTNLEVRRAFKRRAAGQDIEMESTAGDYRTVQGVSEPHRITMRIPIANIEMVLLMQSIVVNVPIDDSRFVRPTAGSVRRDATRPPSH
mgnify:CR=1 FL=1